MTIPPFSWSPTGDDIEDDAVCYWQGMVLRYEQMDGTCWWWAVYLPGSVDDFASSNHPHSSAGHSHHAARLLAEGAALREWVRRMPEGGREGER